MDPATGRSEATALARISAEAVLESLDPWIGDSGTTVHLESLEIVDIGTSEAIVVKVMYGSDETTAALVGAALMEGDLTSAATKAMLSALNRKLALIRSQIVLET